MMSDDLISRQAAISAHEKLIKEISDNYTFSDPIVMAGTAYIGDCIGLLETLPSVNRPTGKWVEQESDGIEKIYLCSYCKNYEAWGETEKTPYCPQCGARMEVEHE